MTLRIRAARTAGAVLALAGFFAAVPLRAQDLEPRAYSPAPTGANFFIVGYSYQSGEVLFDPSLPFSDVHAYLNATTAGYGHSFGFFGRLATAAVVVPYVWGSVSGNVAEQFTKITRSGLGDPRLRFVTNLLGGPALSPREWAARKPETTLGFSLVVVVPTGQYSEEKLINIGTNRWAFKPEFGLSYPAGPWTLEASAGAWFYTHNPEAYPAGTVVRSQDPLVTFQAHVGYTFKPGLWVAGDATFYTGGRTYTNGVPGDTRQSNTRVGGTLSLALAKNHSLKLAVASGVNSRVGSRFDTYGIAYQYLWFSR